MKRSGNPRRFLSAEEVGLVKMAIERMERTTSAEIKVVLLRHCWVDLRKKARRLFTAFHLDNTAERNCILIVLVVANRHFLIYGDEGIHRKVGQLFWDDMRSVMMQHFRNSELGVGLSLGIDRIGEQLAHHFPRRADDKDEVSNDIEYV